MTNSDIEHMAQGYPPSHIGKDHEEVLIELAANVIELQQKLDAMAAENAALMKFCKDAAFDADYESELGMERGGFTDAVNDIKTPVTDAYLNSVRADAVVETSALLADMAEGKSPHTAEIIKSCGRAVFAYASLIRSGTHDTADKAG